MKTLIRLELVLVVVGLLVSSLNAQDSSQDGALRQVEEQVQKRRQMREEIHATSLIGGVFQPLRQDGLERALLEIDGRSVRECAQTYATLTGKEVMVSAKIATIRVSIQARNLSRVEAVAAMNRAFESIGVAVVPVVDSSVALVDATALAKRPI